MTAALINEQSSENQEALVSTDDAYVATLQHPAGAPTAYTIPVLEVLVVLPLLKTLSLVKIRKCEKLVFLVNQTIQST